MPTIEIVSVESNGIILNQSDFDIAIIKENRLISHRGLFYNYLCRQNGEIIHLGNPDLKNEDYGFFAGAIIDWNFGEPDDIVIPTHDEESALESYTGSNQQYYFKFSDEFCEEIDKLLNIALVHSSVKKVYFLTDYQFGPESPRYDIIYTIRDFWDRHNNEGLTFNTLYELYSE